MGFPDKSSEHSDCGRSMSSRSVLRLQFTTPMCDKCGVNSNPDSCCRFLQFVI